MTLFIGRRLPLAIPLLVVVVFIVFVLLQFIPGDPVQAIVGQYPAPPAFRASLDRGYHLDSPVWARFGTPW